MHLHIVSFELNLIVKNNELAFQALGLPADMVFVREMIRQPLIVQVIPMPNPFPGTDEALFVLVAAMFPKLIVAIESRPTKPTLWMPLKRRLILILPAIMGLKSVRSEKLVFMRKDLFMSRANIADVCPVGFADVPTELFPASWARHIAGWVRAVETEKNHSVLEHFPVFEFDGEASVLERQFSPREGTKRPVRRAGEYHAVQVAFTVGTRFDFVESTKS